MASSRQFIDPLGSKLPALEINLLRLRGMQMLLVLFYAEELKRDVLDVIRTTDHLGKALGTHSAERVPKGVKNPVEKALAALVLDKAISIDEKKEIEGLIDYRNAIGHQIHNLLSGTASKGAIRELATGLAEIKKIPRYRNDAVGRLRHYLKLIGDAGRTRHYARTFNFNRAIFHSAERVFLAEIKRLEVRVHRLSRARVSDIKKLNAEMSLAGTGLENEWHPAGPWSKYDNGRLTKIGVEVCYRLFDLGRSPLAVAHLAGFSLVASQKRYVMWKELGGKKRDAVQLASIPRPRFRRRYDDD